MKPAVLLAVLALALPAPVFSWAQPPAAPAAQPSAKALALSKRYIDLIDAPKLIDSMMASLMPQVIASLSDAKDLPPGAIQAITDAARESADAITPKMMDRMVTVYATIFTEDELQALVDFYGGPYGKSIMAKLPKAVPSMTAAMSDLLPEMQADMAQRMCAKLHCDATAIPRKTAA